MDNLFIQFSCSTTVTLTTVVVLFLSTIVLLKKYCKRRDGSSSSRNTATSPPISIPLGTLGWPFIGETIEFITCAYSDCPESFMDKLRRVYGKVFKSHVFGSPTIVSTDADVSRVVLQSDSKNFIPSYPRSLTELIGKSSILLINGNLQKRIHGLIGSFFKSSHIKAQITLDMQKYVQESMALWRDDQLIYIQDETKNVAFHVLVKALISLRSRKGNAIPETRISTIYRGEQLTVDLISDNMTDLMIPGEDSVPVLMTLAVKYLSDCPRALHQLMEENMNLKREKAVLGEPLSWSDYMSLSFTQNVISETLRMGNIVTGVIRKAMRDVEIKGYLIPKGWCVFTYFRSVHLDENLYEWPYQFYPWRWQEKEMGCNFTPFGGGQRLRPGVDLARLETTIFLHHFVIQFRFGPELRRTVPIH
ncbi:hypothetical protein Syun_026313 [Stephania yunnanensis]|uniref:Cytochrome P450 n=1 Tax=Stephania yunnanensis TaxID=152371 RepID=A0AAP0HS24_9MAGN